MQSIYFNMQSFFRGKLLSLQESPILIALYFKKSICLIIPKVQEILEINPTECTYKIELVDYSPKKESNYP